MADVAGKNWCISHFNHQNCRGLLVSSYASSSISQNGNFIDYNSLWASAAMNRSNTLRSISFSDIIGLKDQRQLPKLHGWGMNSRQRATLIAVFQEPPRPDIAWADVESLFGALGAEISEGRGSRVRVAHGGARAVFHRPHPEKEIDRGAVRSVRRFLVEAGVAP